MLKKWSWLIVIFVQFLILIIYQRIYCVNTYNSESVTNNMVSRSIEQREDGSWDVDESCGVSNGQIFLYGPYHKIEKGSYMITIEYEADWNHSMDIYSVHNSNKLFSDKQIILKRGKGIESAKIRVTDDIDDLEIRFYYAGKGYIRIKNVSIVRNNEEIKENVILLIVFMVILDLCLIFVRRKKEWFDRLCPMIAGILTGIAISVGGGVYEGASFIGILSNECDGIGIDKLIVCVAIICFYQKYWYLIDEVKSNVIRGLAVLFSAFIVIGISFASNESLVFVNRNIVQFLISVIVFWGYYYIFRLTITCLFNKINIYSYTENFKFKSFILTDLIEHRPFLLAVLIIMAGWAPYFLIFFPGSVAWDGLWQINEGMGYKALTNHHPWIMSKFMALLMKCGQLVSDNVGILLIVVVFMTIEILCYGYVCYKMKQYTNNFLYGISVLYFTVVPAFSAFASVVIKDAIYASLFAFFMTMYLECVIKVNKKYLLSKMDYVLLGISALLVCITRRNGVYLVLPQCLCLLFWVTKRQILGVILLSISVFAGQIVTDVVLPEYLGVVKGSEREMLSIPFQQTARYLMYFSEDVTEEERAAIDAILPVDKLAEYYVPEKSDSIKARYRGAAVEELKEYFKAWYSMLKKHPEVYIEAILHGSYGYYYPFRNCNASQRYFLYIQGEPEMTGDLYLHYLLSREVRGKMESYTELWVKIPILANLMNPASYTWLLLVLLAYLIYMKRSKGIFMYIGPFINILVCIASPVNGLLRYALPLMSCTPILIGWNYFYNKQNEEMQN